MRIFIDSANIKEIEEMNEMGFIDGVTTNPSLVAKEKRNYKEVIKDICAIVDGPISAEVISQDFEGMLREGEELAQIHHNVVIKVPMNKEGLKVIKVFKKNEIKTNATLVFSANQALLAARAGADFISPFIGRLDDISNNGLNILNEIVSIFDKYILDAEVIAASIRHPIHVVEAAHIGSHIATIPYNILKQMIEHPLTDAGIEKFLNDWKQAF